MDKYQILKIVQRKISADRAQFRRDAKAEGFSSKEIKEMPKYREMLKDLIGAEKILGITPEEMALWEENN